MLSEFFHKWAWLCCQTFLLYLNCWVFMKKQCQVLPNAFSASVKMIFMCFFKSFFPLIRYSLLMYLHVTPALYTKDNFQWSYLYDFWCMNSISFLLIKGFCTRDHQRYWFIFFSYYFVGLEITVNRTSWNRFETTPSSSLSLLEDSNKSFQCLVEFSFRETSSPHFC